MRHVCVTDRIVGLAQGGTGSRRFMLDATPESERERTQPREQRSPSRAHPARGAHRRVKQGPSGDVSPKMRMGSAIERCAYDRLHGRILQAGRCSDPAPRSGAHAKDGAGDIANIDAPHSVADF